jgi:ABC-type glutathione transport system ATPase component
MVVNSETMRKRGSRDLRTNARKTLKVSPTGVELCLPKIFSGRQKDGVTMLHASPSRALTSIWMSMILKLFASDIICREPQYQFARDRLASLMLGSGPSTFGASNWGSRHSVQKLNLSVGPNRITAFLGQNGAGKSTTIKMLLGMVRPSCGPSSS